jgi:hypothetical protein
MRKKAAPLFDPAPVKRLTPPPVELSAPAYRAGKKVFSTWLSEPAIRQLKVCAAEEGTTVQDLVVAMLNKEFARRGKPELA